MSDALEIPRHDDTASKADRGTALVIGGGRETAGSVLLAGLAALRVGAGRLQIATVASVATGLSIAVPEARVIGLPETESGELAADGVPDVASLLQGVDAVLIGPGVLDDVGMDALLEAVLSHGASTVVVDAGALPALGRRTNISGPVIAVPNSSEAEVLGEDAARRLGITVAFRDVTTVVTTPDGRSWTDESGCVGLATSGSGDVAAGVVVGLAARGASPEAAAVWGARLHGRAGQRLPFGFLARELLDELPHVLPTN